MARRGRAALLALSGALWLGLSLCYSVRPDRCAALTVFPPWIWLPVGLLLAGACWSPGTRRIVCLLGFLWLAYLLAFTDEAHALVHLRHWRSTSEASRLPGQTLRVVSLNCAGGRRDAAEEVAAYNPDIVLLQESPGPKDVERLARALFQDHGGALCQGDVAVIARGGVSPSGWHRRVPPYFLQARVRLTSGIEAEVISLHLVVPPLRTDLWNPAAWQEQTANRRRQREQLGLVADSMRAVPGTIPLIVGGDFNAPAGDAIFRLLQPRLHDTFKEGGVGWGDTFMNDFPLLRIDQVWTSEHFRAVAVRARRTEHSDHRMVVYDLLLGRNG